MDIYDGSRTYLASTPNELPSVTGYIRADAEQEDNTKILPFIPGIETVTKKMNEGFKLFKASLQAGTIYRGFP